MQDVFRLRYQVYCRETGFLPDDQYGEGSESDEFDQYSDHIAVYGDDSEPMGCARLVTDPPGGMFPFQKFGAGTYEDYEFPEAAHMAEVSRLIVRSCYRHTMRDKEDRFTTSGLVPAARPRNISAMVQLKLFRLCYRTAKDLGVRHLFAAVESRLARLLNGLHMPFVQIGPDADYYGTIQPYAMDIGEMERVMSEKNPQLWDFFNDPSEDGHSKVFRLGNVH